MTWVDAEARTRIATDLTTTLVVEASAGTGKTTALVSRIIALITSGTTELSRVAAVTFTEKASGEMTLRLRAAIEAARGTDDPVVRRRLDRALRQLEEASIGTIHGFCAELLRERPVQAGLDPLFRVADEGTSYGWFDEVFGEWWTDTLQAMPETLRRYLRRAAARGVSARDELARAARAQTDWRDHRTPLARPPVDRGALVDKAMQALRPYVALADQPRRRSDRAIEHLMRVHDVVRALEERETDAPRDVDAVEAALAELVRPWSWSHKPWVSDHGSFTAAELVALRDRAHAVLVDVTDQLNADLAAGLHTLLWPVCDAYVARLRAEGAVDYFDLLAQTEAVLRDSTDVRGALQERFTHLLVDEFQDTDPLQANILLLLASSDPYCDDPDTVPVTPGKLFVVGDPKQSIYRFRRADVSLYLSIREQLVAQGARVVHLSTSFRSDPRIQQVVNAAFSRAMQGGTQASYVPQQPAREQAHGRPAVIALSLPEPYSKWGRVTQGSVQATEPVAVARFVEWLVRESGWTVRQHGTDTPVPIGPEHICLLFRRLNSYRGPVAGPFADALQSLGLPSILIGGSTLHDREELRVVRTALLAVDRPDDAVAVFATLKGPLFAVGDDALLTFKTRYNSLHPLMPAPDPVDELDVEVLGALTILRELHTARNRVPIAHTLNALLTATRAHAGLALWSGGDRVLANVLAVIEQARRFERQGAPSFRGFVTHLMRQAAGVGATQPSVDDDSDSIRLMSVHKAKGLEFPVVILCDSAYSGVPKKPGRWVDRSTKTCAQRVAGLDPYELGAHQQALVQAEREESDRILYVAATRARELLVVPTVSDEPLRGWTETLGTVLYPPAEAWRDGTASTGCPPFHSDAIVVRPPGKSPPPDSGVRPGQYDQDGLSRVWWDGHLLGPAPTPEAGFRRVDQQLLAADTDLHHAVVNAAHGAWQAAHRSRRERGAVPTDHVASPSHNEGLDITLRDVQWLDLRSDSSQPPAGREFGTLVHGILENIDFSATPEEVLREAQRVARSLGLPHALATHAASRVGHALSHPLFERASAASRVERELAVTHRRDDGVLIDGTADLVFWEGDVIIVVDYKTDHDASLRKEAYTRQLSLYADALHAATGLSVRAMGVSV